MSSLAMLHLAVEGESFFEALIVFLGLLAYAVPAVIRWLQERFGDGTPGAEGAEGERDEPALPGRRPKSRRARGGGTFVGPDGRPARREGRTGAEIFRELMRGGEPERPRRQGGPPVARRPQPAREEPPRVEPLFDPEPPTEPATMTDFGHSLEELHETLDRRRARLEETRESLPSAASSSSLTSLTGLPSEEDALERIGGDSVFATRLSAPSVGRAARARRPARRARSGWRAAVVASELLAPPVALRDPSRGPGGLSR